VPSLDVDVVVLGSCLWWIKGVVEDRFHASVLVMMHVEGYGVGAGFL